MKFRSLVLLLALSVAVPSAFAAQGVLPRSFSAWTASGPQSQIAPQDIEKLSTANAPILREDGITAVERGNYAQGGRTASVAIYRMEDTSGSLAAFTLLREPQMTDLSLGASVTYGAASKNRALLVVGNFVVDVSGAQDRPADADLRALADILRPRSDHTPYPTILSYLPKSGLVTNSEHYVLGRRGLAQAFPVGAINQRDWLAFDKSAEAIIAEYHLSGQAKDSQALVLIALYPTQQIAAEAYNNFSEWISLNGSASPSKPPVFGKRSGALIALVSGASTNQSANALLDQIQYASQVTWNEPSQSLTDPNIGTIVVGAILGTGSIMVFAIVAGIGFGGLRLFTKILFPGKVFDRNAQVEILQLGISSKPIQAKDFYTVRSSRES